MFGRVWKWAGTQRSRETNIGVAPHTITENTQLALGDALFWHEHDTYPLEERAARLHVRLVSVHPFTNGNGRCTRLLADLYLATCDYLAALRAADAGDFGPLVRFARR
jgi:fido (protein-threonine AMPylation protein)